ncbi:DNA adenine methylase [Flavobacterium anhuiense]|uniref:DNA adenine methylase n=1 Tax=Flavobacterium anhuiense TaxID=459526 RepID=UPI0034D95E7B
MDPFLKWAGGKRWLTSKATHLFPDKNQINQYFEPFLGGGAVFFHIKPENNGILSDLNSDLINSYTVIRDDWKNLNDILIEYNALHNSTFYYDIRSTTPESNLEKAARFIYLNRTCWNGLYRVNKNGIFNVPIGTKSKVILDTDNFSELSLLLQSINIESCDFEATINRAGNDDFIFIDPPYTVKHNYNGFIKYNENIFSWEDQIRLRDVIVDAINRGTKILLLNANHNSIKELYNGIGEQFVLDRASVIAGSSNARGIYSELAIKCW